MLNTGGAADVAEDEPGFGSSQATHFTAESVLPTEQTEHVHPDLTIGFKPAADQLNPPEGAAGMEGGAGVVPFVFAAPGLGSSHATHCVAESLLLTMQVEHDHPALTCGFAPAAPQLNPPEGILGMATGGAGVGLLEPGLGSSHATHCAAESLLLTMQVEHVHPALTCGLAPAAPQLKPPEGMLGMATGGAGAGLLEPGLGSSHAVHCIAESSLLTMQVGHDHPALA